MTEHVSLAERYIAAWNETDDAERRALVAQLWSPDGRYVDPLMAGRGPSEIAAMIGAAQQKFPGFRFALRGKVDGHGDHLRFSWQLGPADGEGLIEGTDFCVVREGRLERVVGFLDRVPSDA
jgi:hypothetical protein